MHNIFYSLFGVALGARSLIPGTAPQLDLPGSVRHEKTSWGEREDCAGCPVLAAHTNNRLGPDCKRLLSWWRKAGHNRNENGYKVGSTVRGPPAFPCAFGRSQLIPLMYRRDTKLWLIYCSPAAHALQSAAIALIKNCCRRDQPRLKPTRLRKAPPVKRPATVGRQARHAGCWSKQPFSGN